MSVVTLQLGQCGNQVGCHMFSTLANDLDSKKHGTSPKLNQDYVDESTETFFSQSDSSTRDSNDKPLLKARAVLVDMESKAISQSLQQAKKSGRWSYGEKQSFCQKRGSGNNWAHGFCVHGPKSHEDIMNLVRKEVEKCERLGGFFNLLSLAGGTGSGVGAYVTQSLRDEFPHSFIMNQVVWPYSTGEVIVQNYNAVLTLSHLYDTVDALVVMENDSLHKICSQLLNIKSISFQDINRVISHKITSVLQPSKATWTGGTDVKYDIGLLLEQLVPHPQHKLLNVRNIPQMSDVAKEFSVYHWPGLMKNLRQMLIADAPMEEGINWDIRPSDRTADGHTCFNRSLASMLVLRGQDVTDIDTSMFSDPRIYTPWTSPDLSCTVAKQPRWFNSYEKTAALISNSQASTKPMTRIIDKAWNMFSTRAYVHQYLKHGLLEDDFLDSFVNLERVMSAYRNL